MAHPAADAERLLAFDQLADPQIDRDRRLVVNPVIVDIGTGAVGHQIGGHIGQERLGQAEAEIAARIASGNRPDLADQQPVGHRPGLLEQTPVGPAPHFLAVNSFRVPVGSRNAGPAPQMIPFAPTCFGEKKKL
jgi:hypothetical protein